MEEKKSKVVEMNAQSEQKQQKLTYDQLNEACSQLFQQNQYLTKQIRELNLVNTFKRLDYLFKVVELDHQTKIGSHTFTSDFTENCIKEIEETLTIPESENSDEEKK